MASAKQVVGNPTPRIEGELKVNGQAKYAVDITLPGMLWGKLLRSPIASGKIKRIDTGKAAAIKGVRASKFVMWRTISSYADVYEKAYSLLQAGHFLDRKDVEVRHL